MSWAATSGVKSQPPVGLEFMPVCKTLSPASQPHQHDSGSAAPVERFSDLDLSEIMLESLAQAEYESPTPVQAGIIPHALAGTDVLGQARTGTGKTAAFAIPILEKLEHGRKGAPPQALVLVPTRELAVQVREEIEKLSHGRRTSCVPVYGGKPIRGQISKLQQGADVVVGTPGRVLDLIGRGSLDLRSIRIVVLDEADRMLDIGFRPDIEKILRRCPAERQTLLLSATVAPPVERLARKYMRDPEVLDFSSQTMTVDTIEQSYFTVDHERKYDLLVASLETREAGASDRLSAAPSGAPTACFASLSKQFDGVDAIHGDMVQTARDSVMKRFRAGEVHILVATDVVGRGIDVSSISHIINLRHSAVVRRLRPPRRPHGPHGPRWHRVHVRHHRRRRRAHANRNADQSAAEARRDRRLCRRRIGSAAGRCNSLCAVQTALQSTTDRRLFGRRCRSGAGTAQGQPAGAATAQTPSPRTIINLIHDFFPTLDSADSKERSMSESEPTPPAAQPPEVLNRAFKAFKKRLKLTQLDYDSRIGVGPMSSGSSSAIVAITPPNDYPRAVWDALVEQGRLKRASQGQYELVRS